MNRFRNKFIVFYSLNNKIKKFIFFWIFFKIFFYPSYCIFYFFIFNYYFFFNFKFIFFFLLLCINNYFINNNIKNRNSPIPFLITKNYRRFRMNKKFNFNNMTKNCPFNNFILLFKFLFFNLCNFFFYNFWKFRWIKSNINTKINSFFFN